jgi:hypothetical protein
LEKAQKLAETVDFKLSAGIITVFTDYDMDYFQDLWRVLTALIASDISSLIGCKTLSSHFVSLLSAFIKLTTKSDSGLQKDHTQTLENLSSQVILPWLDSFCGHDELVED